MATCEIWPLMEGMGARILLRVLLRVLLSPRSSLAHNKLGNCR